VSCPQADGDPAQIERVEHAASFLVPLCSLALQAYQGNPQFWPAPSIDRANQVWTTDITYIPMSRGFVYLTAVMGWFARRILTWRVNYDGG
jgi:putative transposase